MSTDLSGKRLEILKELVPRIRHIGVLYNPASAAEATNIVNWEAAARTLDMEAQRVEIRLQSEINNVISEIAQHRLDALAVVPGTLFVANRRQIVAAIANLRLPAIYGTSGDTDAGGLISYGTNFTDLYRRATTYVDKILKASKAEDLSIEQPTKFELVINLKTAKGLGTTIPPSVLLRVDKVIE
jgi:putative ABC transport system substrate-binding protein